jgi:hypothetical protein
MQKNQKKSKNGKKWQKRAKNGVIFGRQKCEVFGGPRGHFLGGRPTPKSRFLTNFSRKIQFLVKNDKKRAKKWFLKGITHKIVENVFFRHDLS